MPKFEHFIITPFNVHNGVKPRDYILGSHYLSSRLKLFQEVCYSSICKQSNQNFHWLVFIDEETPNIYRETLENLAIYANLSIVLTEPYVNFQPFLVKTIKERLEADTEFLITSSLDSDDSFHENYINLVQGCFKNQNFEFINFPFGYLLTKEGLFQRQYLSSTFISLIEKIDEPIMTTKVMSHSQVFELFKQGLNLRQVITYPAWLQIVHDNNLLTRRDINAVLQPIESIGAHFGTQEFAKSHVEVSYTESLVKYLRETILANKYNLPLGKRISNTIALINPSISKYYLYVKLKLRSVLHPAPKISINEMKSLCLQQPTHWRKGTEEINPSS